MLKKLGLGLIALSIGSSSFALELYKGSIVSHKESTTGGIKAVLKQQPRRASLRALEDSDEESNGNMVNVYNSVYQQSAILGQPTKIDSEQSVFIVNETDVAQTYNISTSVCVDASNDNKSTGQCYNAYDTINLEPRGYYDANQMPELLVAFNDLSPRNLTANIEVSRVLSSGDIFSLDYIGSASSETNLIVTAQQ